MNEAGPSLPVYVYAVLFMAVDDIALTDISFLRHLRLFHCTRSQRDRPVDVGLQPAEIIEATDGFNGFAVEKLMLVFRRKRVLPDSEVEWKVVGFYLKVLFLRYLSAALVFFHYVSVPDPDTDALLAGYPSA